MEVKVLVFLFTILHCREVIGAKQKYPRQASDYDYGSSSSIKNGYSSGSGLRSIAQGSANQAQSIVTNQHIAANQAAYVAKNTLAQHAVQASQVAQAALAGKQVLLQGLEQQTLEAHQSLESEIKQLQQAKRAAKSAQIAAQQALNHVNILQNALNNAHQASEHAQQSANEAAAELASQTAMVGSAKKKLEEIEEHLARAKVDYEATKSAAENAQASATIAQNVAAEAAAEAASLAHDQVRHQIEQNNDHSFEESDSDEHQSIDTSSAFSDKVPSRVIPNRQNRGEFQGRPQQPAKNHNYNNHKTATEFPFAGY